MKFKHIQNKIFLSFFAVILASSLIIVFTVSFFIHKVYFDFILEDLKEDAGVFIYAKTKAAIRERDTEFLNELLLRTEEYSTVEILDAKGMLLASSEGIGAGRGVDLGKDEFSGRGYGIRGSAGGTEKIYCALPVIDGGQTIGYVRISMRTEEMERAVRRMQGYITLIFIAALVIVSLLSILFSRSISSPLLEMARAAKDVSSGNLDRRVRVKSKDEIGALAAAFNDMVARLKNLNDERNKLISNISHEIMTPLTSIRGFLETLSDGKVRDGRDIEECLRVVKRESAHLEGLMDELRLLSNIDGLSARYRLEPVYLEDAINEAVKTLAVKAKEKEIRINSDFIKDCPPVRGDARALKQVFLNLIDNAVKYSPRGEEIHISMRRRDRFLDVAVEDRGVGIDAQDRERIFERFYRIDDGRHTEEGIGLGLAIVKEILRIHKADIAVESRPSKGSRFTVTFPIA